MLEPASGNRSHDHGRAVFIAGIILNDQNRMDAALAHWLVHGHTHQPADHALGGDQWRIVLSDWHIDGDIYRAEVLRVTPEGWQRIPPELA
mgnify:CR=1 FL=1